MKNRDMFYQNVNQGYQNPGQFIPPSGYNMNTNYQAFGPNIMPNQVPQYNNQMQNNSYQSYEDYMEEKFDKIDRQIKNLDTRLQKLESVDNTDNIYMI